MVSKPGQVRIKSVQCISPEGLHQMGYKEWGASENPNVLVCVHGVTRVSDDFDALASELSAQYRVICPDIVGRGRSGWFRNAQYYQVQQYVSDLVTLIARLDTDRVSYVGTSMGGMIGMGLASLKDTPIHKMVLNDIGPVLNVSAIGRIGQYIGQPMTFSTFDEAASYIRSISTTFGEHTEEEWHKLCSDVLRQDKNGKWVKHYDISLALPMQAITPELAQASQLMLWAAYDAISCPVLLLRGKESDLLSHETAIHMTQRGPRARMIEFEKVGHAPTLVHPDQIAAIQQFLRE